MGVIISNKLKCVSTVLKVTRKPLTILKTNMGTPTSAVITLTIQYIDTFKKEQSSDVTFSLSDHLFADRIVYESAIDYLSQLLIDKN